MHGKAKEQAEIDSEKEILEISTVQAMGKNKSGIVTQSKLQENLDSNAGGGKTEVYDVGKKFEVIFIESNRYYEVNKEGNVGEAKKIEKDNCPGDIEKDINGNILDGSIEKPYEINCIEDLVAFSNMVNGEGYKLEDGKAIEIKSSKSFENQYVVLKRNLNFESVISYNDSKRTDFGDINGNTEDGNQLMTELTKGNGFKPIGLASANHWFSGNFNGLGNKIEEIYIDRQDTDIGLFGALNAHSCNITIQNVGVSGQINANSEGNAGGIAGYMLSQGNYYIEISNCYNFADINSNSNGSVGGIVGLAQGTTHIIKNCYNLGNITHSNNRVYGGAGGILGFVYGPTTFKNCYNVGNVTSENDTGGIVGFCYQQGHFFNCYNVANSLIGGNNVGGISGNDGWKTHNYINCYNMANKMEGTNIGGIAGFSPYMDYITVTNCYYDKNLAEKGINNWTEVAGNGIERAEINSEEIVKQLNAYIEKGTENEEGIDTSDWKKWKIGEKGYPVYE